MAPSTTQQRMNLTSGKSTAVECLGLTFTDDNDRRTYFRARLREFLADPAFRAQGGFPIGSDDAIVEMSDPPYYTACPNPFLLEGLSREPMSSDGFSPDPFTADVSEGKNDPTYNAHSYHTKVPYKAIVRYLMHYTRPGDIVFDGFCGTGMTGLAAQLCADKSLLREMGYDKKTIDELSGRRSAVLADLSPAATFIARSYNISFDPEKFVRDVEHIIKSVEDELGWMYATKHTDGADGRINYTVWSDVFSCPECGHESSFWNLAVEKNKKELLDEFDCPGCSFRLNKRRLERVLQTVNDPASGVTRVAKQLPVLINYSVGRNRFEKDPDDSDLLTLSKVEAYHLDQSYPTNRMIIGGESRRNDPIGMTHVHHYFTRRNLSLISLLFERAEKTSDPLAVRQAILDCLPVVTKLSRFRVPAWFDKSTGPMKGWTAGTLYAPSLQGEQNVLNSLAEKAKMVGRSYRSDTHHQWITTGDSSSIPLPDDTLDYIFLDPPFGANLNYSELNFISESWLRVWTNNGREAISNPSQGKDLFSYRELMTSCFREAYRLLKPGRWMTVEFSNTQASVWNSIQTALQEAGFVVANVSALDKKQGSFKAVTTTTAVKQDLVISAYKPNGGMEARFVAAGGTPESAWDFVQTHLKYLPVVKEREGNLQFIAERDPRIIFDRMVAWFVRHNTPVPLSSAEFQAGVEQRLPTRDGMVFLPNQLDEYDRKRIQSGQVPQRELFVDDERSAIDWLTDFLRVRPSTYQEVHPEFTRQTGAGWRKHEMRPELQRLLEDNFLECDGTGSVPPQVHSYLSSNWKELRGLDKTNAALLAKARGRWYVPDPAKRQDVERRREKALLAEFDRYRTHSGRKLKEVRLEVLRAGFKRAWAAKDYEVIRDVADRVTEDAWQEDEKLLTLYDMAETRLRAGK